MPPPHNWWLRLRLMHTQSPPLPLTSPAKTNPPFLQPHYCIVTAPKSPWQQTCATACPPSPAPPSHPRHLSSACNSGEQNRWRLPRWSTEVDTEKGNKISFVITCHLKDSLLVRLVAIGNCEDTDYKEQQAGRRAGSRWWVFTVTRRDGVSSWSNSSTFIFCI